MEVKALKTAMTDSISEVLETMFFLPLDMDDADKPQTLWPSEDEDILVSQLNFNGPFSGRFYFFIPNSLAVSITTSFLGIGEDDLTGEQLSETVNEIINMVAGNTFSKFDDQQIFDLDMPVPVRFKDVNKDCSDIDKEIFIPIRTLEDRLAFLLSLDA